MTNEDLRPMSTNEGQVSLTMEGHSRPEVSVATWAAGDPGLVDCRGRRIPPPKPPRLHRPQPIPKPPRLHRPPTPPQPKMDRQLKVFNCNWELGAEFKWTRPDDLELKEAEPRGEKGGGGWGVELHRSLWGRVGARHSGSTPRGCPGAKTGLRLVVRWTSGGEHVLLRALGCGWVLSLGGTWKCRHAGDLFSSHNSSTSPGGRASCRPSQGARCRDRPGGVSSSRGPAASSSRCS
uniref:Uncharacterized protein n=1 Tax=Molossus molossus TaxID=27622 RepID=A0A7J8EF90_MOLMO|nr:hypothetical protein HJG59_008891 [Molossus molossus]